MELLLYLIKKEELDLNDIPIARITKQYLDYVVAIKDLNLEAAGDFILMAATLIRIKTKMLLPRDEADPDEPDPRDELVMALLEYKRFKEAPKLCAKCARAKSSFSSRSAAAQLRATRLTSRPARCFI